MRKYLVTATAMILICNAGNAQQAVGIGTATPHSSAMLEVASTSKGLLIPRMSSTDRTNIISPAAGLMVYDNTTNSHWVYNGSAWVQLVAGGVSPWTTAGNNIYNSNTGNVGVGTTAPGEKLHIIGNGMFGGNNPTIQLQNSGVDKGFIQLAGDNIRMGTNSGNNLGKLVFRMDGSDKIFIDSTGNMQIIGEQDAELNTHGYLMLGSVGGTNLIFDNNEMMARNNGAASNLIMQNDGGNVGIGVASPNDRLDINGSARLSGGAQLLKLETDQATDVIRRFAPGVRYIRADNTILGTIEYVDTFNFANFLRLRTGSAITHDLTINSDHNVGIGTQDPSARLHIVGNSGGEQLRITALSDPIIQFTTGGGPVVQTKKAFIDVSGNDFRIGTNAENNTGDFIVRTNGTNRIYVDENGIVSIGTQTAAAGYMLRVGGKMICEEVKVKLQSSGWPDYVFSDRYKLMPLNELGKFVQKNQHLPNIPASSLIEKDGFELGDMQKRLMEKVEELTLYILQQQKEIDELRSAVEKK